METLEIYVKYFLVVFDYNKELLKFNLILILIQFHLIEDIHRISLNKRGNIVSQFQIFPSVSRNSKHTASSFGVIAFLLRLQTIISSISFISVLKHYFIFSSIFHIFHLFSEFLLHLDKLLAAWNELRLLSLWRLLLLRLIALIDYIHVVCLFLRFEEIEKLIIIDGFQKILFCNHFPEILFGITVKLNITNCLPSSTASYN